MQSLEGTPLTVVPIVPDFCHLSTIGIQEVAREQHIRSGYMELPLFVLISVTGGWHIIGMSVQQVGSIVDHFCWDNAGHMLPLGSIEKDAT